MSLFADYKREREGKDAIETDWGFATFAVQGETVYIEDLFVARSERGRGRAAHLTDMVVEKAKASGCKVLIGSVLPQAHGSTDAMKAFLAYGMKLAGIRGELIILTKEI